MSLARSVSRLAIPSSSRKTVLFTNNCIIAQNACRCLSTSSSKLKDSPNQDYAVSTVYQNRNPRNLEKLGLARKRLGWKFQAPRKDYYHKLVLSNSNQHTEAWVEHGSGEIVLSATTKEWAIRNQLYSCKDVSASTNIGRILAQRCLEGGITSVYFDESELNSSSERTVAFLQAFKDAKISLTEPEMIVPDYKPGINYDGYNRYAEPKEWKEDYQHI